MRVGYSPLYIYYELLVTVIRILLDKAPNEVIVVANYKHFIYDMASLGKEIQWYGRNGRIGELWHPDYKSTMHKW